MKQPSKQKETYRQLAIDFKANRDIKTYTKLYHKMRPGLWKYVYNKVNDYDIADEITSTTLYTIYNKIESYNEDYQITTWAYRIASNACAGWFWTKRKDVSLTALSDAGIDVDSSTREYVINSTTFDELSILKEEEAQEQDDFLQLQYDTMIEEIRKLPVDCREFVYERYVNGKSHKEIIADLKDKYSKCTPQTVKNRLHKGRKILLNNLKNIDIFNDTLPN